MYYCSIFLENIPSISGPAQFKPVLFKVQLYLMWYIYTMGYSVKFSSVTQSCLTLCDPMNRSTPGLPVHHQLPEFTQTHVH